MTDRHTGYVITLKDSIREDDAEAVINALKMIKGVVSVKPVIHGDIAGMVGASRRDVEWREKIIELLEEMHG